MKKREGGMMKCPNCGNEELVLYNMIPYCHYCDIPVWDLPRDNEAENHEGLSDAEEAMRNE